MLTMIDEEQYLRRKNLREQKRIIAIVMIIFAMVVALIIIAPTHQGPRATRRSAAASTNARSGAPDSSMALSRSGSGKSNSE